MHKNQRNYYRILHVQPDAPLALIRTSYRTLMQKLRKHPDLGGDEWDAAVLNEAFAALSDAARRKAYDAKLFADRGHADTGRQHAAQRRTAAETASSRHADRHDTPSSGARRASAAYACIQDAARCDKSMPHAYQTRFVEAHNCAFCGTAFRGVLDAETDCVHCASPLQPHTPVQLESTCQRNVHRIPRLSELHLHTAWPGAAETALLNDLSPNGLQFVAAIKLLPGQRVRVAGPMFVAVAEIANRSRHAGRKQRYGARFITLRYQASRGTFLSASV